MLQIRICDGGLMLYDSKTKKIQKLENPDLTVDLLKASIDETIKTLIEPMKVRDLIYLTLSKVSGYEVTKKPSSEMISSEKEDPLFLELSSYVLGLESYKKLTYSYATLKVTDKYFILTDINGESIIPDESIKLDKLRKLSYREWPYETTQDRALRMVFTEYFGGIKVIKINFENEIIRDVIATLPLKKYPRKIAFKDGKICVRIGDTLYPPDEKITVEALKEMIKKYIVSKKATNIPDIIFGSLEKLSGLIAIRNQNTYIPLFKNGKKVKDVQVTDSLYAELYTYVNKLPEYKEVVDLKKAQNARAKEKANKTAVLRKEQRFVDSNYALYGIRMPKQYHRK